ncbi:MAG: sporulation protein [Nocardiaceae bacterium]|nr:sporulation protein [Nocardiaceae bacterium]
MGFKRLLAGVGAGGASVETVLRSAHVAPGGTIAGDIHVIGGTVDQVIERVAVSLATRVEIESGDNEYLSNVEFSRQVVWGSFQVQPGQRFAIPFELVLPWETPITVLGGRAVGSSVGVRTELEIARSIDKGDLDPIAVHPLPAQSLILDALVRLGFGFRRADVEKGHIRGVHQALPFYQEIEFAPGRNYPGINELEVTFVAGPTSMYVVLEADKRGGMFTEGHDSFHGFTVDYASASNTDWAGVLHNWLSSIGQRRSFF